MNRDVMKKELNFERVRLCGLIESKVNRSEIESAIEFARELFHKETSTLFISWLRKIKNRDRIMKATIKVLLVLLFAAVLGIALNFEPLLDLKIEGALIFTILIAIILDGFVIRRFCTGVARLLEEYESAEHLFVQRILHERRGCGYGLKQEENPLFRSGA